MTAFERFGNERAAGDTVAFADEIERRFVDVVPEAIDANELGDRFGIAAALVKLRGVFGLHRAAIAGADGVDEDEVGEGEPRILVVDERSAGGRQARHGAGGESDAPGSETEEMDKAGVGAGAAIPQKSERARRRPGWPIERVRDVEHVGVDVAGVVIADRNEASLGGVL